MSSKQLHNITLDLSVLLSHMKLIHNVGILLTTSVMISVPCDCAAEAIAPETQPIPPST